MSYTPEQIKEDIKKHEGIDIILNHKHKHFTRLYSEVYPKPVEPEALYSTFLDRLTKFLRQYTLRLV